MSKFVLIRSWHSISGVSRAGLAMTRCGLTVAIEGSFVPEGTKVHETADHLPLDEHSCESCLRLLLHDEESPPDVPNDEVPA